MNKVIKLLLCIIMGLVEVGSAEVTGHGPHVPAYAQISSLHLVLHRCHYFQLTECGLVV